MASDSLQIVGDLLDPFEGVLERLAVAAAKPNESRHNLDAFVGALVPEMEALAPVRRLDQPDPCAPRIHRKLPFAGRLNRLSCPASSGASSKPRAAGSRKAVPNATFRDYWIVRMRGR